MPVKQGMSSLEDGFRVRYLGSLGFANGSRKAGMQTLQRPMLQLYSTARRKGEDHRSRHPLALTQFLDVSSYGLVVVDIEEDPEDGELSPVITKVITPIENVILWAAVRFHARPTKRRSMGAAFVPIACSDGVLDKNSFIQLGSKQRFLVSLTHPPLFVCLLQSVSSPKSVECHAFVCASAEDSLSICSMVSGSKEERVPSGTLSYYSGPRSRAPSSQTYRSRDASNSEEDLLSTMTPSSMTTMTEEGTASQITIDSSRLSRSNQSNGRVHGRRSQSKRSISCPRPNDDSSLDYAEWTRDHASPVLGRRYTNGVEKVVQTPRLSQRFVQSGLYAQENGYKPVKPPRLRSKNKHREEHSSSPSVASKNTSDYDKIHVMNPPESSRASPPSDYHKILMRLDLRDSPPTELEKMQVRLPRESREHRSDHIIMNIPKENGHANGAYQMNGDSLKNGDMKLSTTSLNYNGGLSGLKSVELVKLPESKLPRYQFGQTEKSFQTNGGPEPSSSNSPSRLSSDLSYAPPKPPRREMVTVSHTVDFSSEGESEQLNDYASEDERRRRRQRKKNLINQMSNVVRSEYSAKKETGTMTDKRAWTTENTSSELDDSDALNRRYSRSKQNQTEVKMPISLPRRMSRDSLELPNHADVSSDSELNIAVNPPKVIRNSDKGVWVHPAVFQDETGHKSFDRRKQNKRESEYHQTRTEYINSGKGFLEDGVPYEKNLLDENGEQIVGNGTSKVTISVPYYQDSGSMISESSYLNNRTPRHPHGVRSFHRRDQVRNWSTVSVTSDQSYQGSSTLPLTRVPKAQSKVIRWSSVERLPRKRNLFTTIKRFSVRSLSRAKVKTGQLLNSLKAKMKAERQVKKGSDVSHATNSGDSAYDTSEVCLRPDGNGIRKQSASKSKKKRRESWSFHDLRSEFPEGQHVQIQRREADGGANHNPRGSPVESGTSGNSARDLVSRKKKRKPHYSSGSRLNNSHDSSDSGVEEYPSDYSEVVAGHRRLHHPRARTVPRRAESDPEHLASVVNVNHGRLHNQSRRNQGRWSQTDLHGELGYIP